MVTTMRLVQRRHQRSRESLLKSRLLSRCPTAHSQSWLTVGIAPFVSWRIDLSQELMICRYTALLDAHHSTTGAPFWCCHHPLQMGKNAG